MKKYILSIDQSTSATKAFVFDSSAEIVARYEAAHGQYYPEAGFVEHDANEIYENTLISIRMVLQKSGLSLSEICAIAISNQRETVVAWDKLTGEPVRRAIVWQCGRAREICTGIEKNGHESMVKEKTGLILSPYFSAGKLGWIMKHVESAAKLASENRLMCGTIDTWLIWKLTGGHLGGVHATDYSNASRTQLFNIHSLKWDNELTAIFGVPIDSLPAVKYSDEIFGKTIIDGVSIPITGVMGDSHAAFFAQSCFEKGDAKATYGTGSSVMMNIGSKPIDSKNGIVTSIGYSMDHDVTYVFEGNINATGATIKWLAENLEIIKVQDTEAAAISVPSSLGVYIVPAFTGLGAPHWDGEARAIISGLTFGATRAHIVRAGLESIAYQIRDVIDAMQEGNPDFTLNELRVDGGPTVNQFLMQFQADILDKAVSIHKTSELSALGSAFMAGLSQGVWSGTDEIARIRQEERKYLPVMEADSRADLYAGWKSAVRRACMK